MCQEICNVSFEVNIGYDPSYPAFEFSINDSTKYARETLFNEMVHFVISVPAPYVFSFIKVPRDFAVTAISILRNTKFVLCGVFSQSICIRI